MKTRISTLVFPRLLVCLVCLVGAVSIACGHGERPLDPHVRQEAEKSPFTAMIFVALHCPVQQAHEARLHALVNAYRGRGVRMVAVASEVDTDAAEARAMGDRLGIEVLLDRNATIADSLGAEFSTHTVILDRDAHILYSGALDSDRTHLRDDAKLYARDALEAALAGRPVAQAHTEALGCSLRKH